ncbi:histidine kinase [Chitinophaga horti]|uniref:Histidine kinase n=1 Tax=Chitinophaga horti TaxID=2920382 RepID=A0ABY6J5G4_9BACT|nr:tetratricopeptide repeat protein [Chitinophaga horti]UYQ94920.1 histidine kinase [Chitinophaga horti]
MLMRIAAFLILFLCNCLSPSFAQSKQDEAAEFIRRGNSQLWKFKPDAAYRHYRHAYTVGVEMDNSYWKGEGLFGMGQAQWYMGRFQDALDTVKLAVEAYRRVKSRYDIGAALRILSNIYDDMGDYENAFKTAIDGLNYYKSNARHDNHVLLLVQLGALYAAIDDYQTSLEYFEKAESLKPDPGSYPYRELHHRIGDLYANQGDRLEARRYYARALRGNPKSKIIRLRMGDIYLAEKQYDTAFNYYDSLYQEAIPTTDGNVIIGAMMGMGRVYLQRGQYAEAARMINGSLQNAAPRGDRKSKRDAYRLLADIAEAQGDSEGALQHLKRYEALKDSVVSENFKRQLFTFRQDAEAEKLVNQRNMLGIAILAIVVVGLSVLFIVLLRHKNEKLQLRQRADELKMQALRSQMNPHFIFNCLSSINHFILNEEGDKASEYLTRFSKLIRTVLVNAGKTTITLEEELAMLQLYLNMEQLRFKEAFDYFLYFDPGLHPSMINVPSFILQPFCENAIWHGLLHKEGKGRLEITFSMRNDILVCTIRDNGIGRERAQALKTSPVEKGASFGNRLSEERLAIFNGEAAGTSFVMEDLRDEQGRVTGTLVTLKIYNKTGA